MLNIAARRRFGLLHALNLSSVLLTSTQLLRDGVVPRFVSEYRGVIGADVHGARVIPRGGVRHGALCPVAAR